MRGVDNDGADVVRVGFERRNFLGRVVVVYPQLEIIGATNNPILSGNEAPGSDRDIGEFKGFDNGLNKESIREKKTNSYCQF